MNLARSCGHPRRMGGASCSWCGNAGRSAPHRCPKLAGGPEEIVCRASTPKLCKSLATDGFQITSFDCARIADSEVGVDYDPEVGLQSPVALLGAGDGQLGECPDIGRIGSVILRENRQTNRLASLRTSESRSTRRRPEAGGSRVTIATNSKALHADRLWSSGASIYTGFRF